MALSNDIISLFVKSTNDSTDTTSSSSMYYGTVVEYNGEMCVQLDGSNVVTPVTTTVALKAGERVTVVIENHSATVTGNTTNPSAGSEEVAEIGSKISEFEVIVAYKVSADEIEAINAAITSLRAKLAMIDKLAAVEADITKLEAKLANIDTVNANDVNAINADIENLRAEMAKFTDVSTEDLDALNAEIDNLKGYTADFTYVSADVLTALKADIKTLDTKKLSAKQADLKYAEINFSNIGEAAIKNFYATSGIIQDLVISEGTITGTLVGVTIKGDLIEGGTVVADKLVFKGDDGLYYKLNKTGETISTEQTEYNSLNGSILTANSVTAEKVNVDDLVAFDATIGGFNITSDSIYSGVKSSVDNTTSGIYMDKTGQIAFGDSSNFLRYYKDEDAGVWKLEIAAGVIKMGGTNQTIEEAIEEVKNDLDAVRDEITTLLRIESSRGTVFKNDQVATVLSVVIYHGNQRITDSTTMKQVFGSSAYLQWKWQRLDDETFGVLSAADSRFGDDGFTFTLSPDDVDVKVTFMCELIV